MRTRTLASAIGAIAALSMAATVRAQTPSAPAGSAPALSTQTTPAAAAPTAETWSITGFGGLAAVQNVGGLAGARISRHVSNSIDITGEASWMQDTVTRRSLDVAHSVAAKLPTVGGTAATGDLKVPTWAYTGGVTIAVTHGPKAALYVSGAAGAARLVRQPTFTVGGTDVTANLGQYGVVLGEDLTGTSTVAAFGGGLGVRVPHGAWVFDAGVSVLSLRAQDDTANVIRVAFGVGRKF